MGLSWNETLNIINYDKYNEVICDYKLKNLVE